MRQLITVGAAMTAVAGTALIGVAPAAVAGPARPARTAAVQAARSSKPTVVYRKLRLLGGQTAMVFSNGIAEVWNADHRKVEYRLVPLAQGAEPGTAAALPHKPQLTWDLSHAPAHPYAAGEVEVVLPSSVAAAHTTFSVPAPELGRLRSAAPRPGALPRGPVPRYTSSAALNRLFAGLGVARMARLLPRLPAVTSRGGIDLSRVYLMRITAASVPAAVMALLRAHQVAYAEPDWTVSATDTGPVSIPAAARTAAEALASKLALRRARAAKPASAGPGTLPAPPTNFALQTSEQSLLNRPGIDWVPGYEALAADYHQLPGAGEIITDVSLGDLTSAGVAASDPCSGFVNAFGPTTIVSGGQRYLDYPSMPLIPTWTASSSAALDPTGEVCGVDPFDDEIGLDFSMMAPLPDGMQRAGELGSGLTDLLGVAPGAQYRLVVPDSASATVSDLDATFLAAAQQSPRPNVITASIDFGTDAEGMPTRYLEDDPITEALVTALVHSFHIIVSISSGDGLRTFTNAAVPPSGGAAATNVARAANQVTSLNDLQLSSAPSADLDSGSIDAGGVTLDDVFAAPPQDPANAALAAQQAFPDVRWDGFSSFASGYGSRVNLSAPADNVVSFEHTFGGAADQVTPIINGGTSASVQEIGAVAAIAQQAARLTGNRHLADDPVALRSYLEDTAAPVPAVPQADRALNVGPQVDLGAAVSGLLDGSAAPLPAGVARVAIAQRRLVFDVAGEFTSVTDPTAISMTGSRQDAWITIAPDWTGLPGGTRYQLYALPASGGLQLLASGPWARLLPATILAAAGLAPSSQQSQSVTLSYQATVGGHTAATATIPLTFDPVSGSPYPLAPDVAPVSSGPDITVRYNLAGQTRLTNPQLVVTAPGRMSIVQNFYHPIYTVPLAPGSSGTVQIPVSALQGGGVYGVGIQASPSTFFFSDFAYTRVPAAPSDVRPDAPLLSAPGSAAGHLLFIPYGGKLAVTWSVADVPGATGALLEISAGGPTAYGSFATFNNPDGTIRDSDGQDFGSVYAAQLSGTSGQTTLTGLQAGLFPGMFHNVRVIPLLPSGAAAGEGSDISTISMDGVAPADGGFVSLGYGINESGQDGFLTSNQINASGQLQTSVETFSQATNAITGTVAATTSGDEFATTSGGGAGMFPGDTGLYGDFTNTSVSYDLLHPVSTGTAAGQWTPSESLTAPGSLLLGADDQQDPDTAFLSFTDAGQPQVFTSDVTANTFGQAIPIGSALAGLAAPFTTGVAQDGSTGEALVVAADFANLSAGSALIRVNLQTGTVATIPSVGDFYSNGVAVDPTKGVAAGPEIDGLALYDLTSGTGTFVQPGGFVYQNPAADPRRGEFVVQEIAPPGTDGTGTTLNNNSLSAELVLSDNGTVLARIPRFNFFNIFTLIGGVQNQINPGARSGYTFGLNGQQLAPFRY